MKELLFEGASYEIPVIRDGFCLLLNENVPTAHLIQDFSSNYKTFNWEQEDGYLHTAEK